MTKKVLIRFDDICPTMDWTQWQRAEDLLINYGVKPLIGVIPDCKDPDLLIDAPRQDFWEWIVQKQNEGYAIAMHGCNHVFCSKCHGILNYRMNSEFAGLTYEEQLSKIRKGKKILESHGVHTDIFFAPAHSYDENTVKALAACGFKYISDGKSTNAYEWHGIKFLPCRNSGGSFNQRESYSTSIYHAHRWIDKDNEKEFFVLKNILEKYKGAIVNFQEYAQQKYGEQGRELLIERVYVMWACKVKVELARIKHLLLRR